MIIKLFFVSPVVIQVGEKVQILGSWNTIGITLLCVGLDLRCGSGKRWGHGSNIICKRQCCTTHLIASVLTRSRDFWPIRNRKSSPEILTSISGRNSRPWSDKFNTFSFQPETDVHSWKGVISPAIFDLESTLNSGRIFFLFKIDVEIKSKSRRQGVTNHLRWVGGGR